MSKVSQTATAVIMIGCAGALAAAPALAAPAHVAASGHTVKSGETTLVINSKGVEAEIGAGFALSPTGATKMTSASPITVQFPVVGGSVNGSGSAGTIRQSGGLEISKGGKSVDFSDAIANIKAKTATETVSGTVSKSDFPAIVLGKPKTKVTKSGATFSKYQVKYSASAVKFLDSEFKTKIFKQNSVVGVATTKVKF